MRQHAPLSTLTVHEAARLLGVTAPTAYSWVRNGELPHIRLGGRIRIPTARLADLLGVDPADLTRGLES